MRFGTGDQVRVTARSLGIDGERGIVQRAFGDPALYPYLVILPERDEVTSGVMFGGWTCTEDELEPWPS